MPPRKQPRSNNNKPSTNDSGAPSSAASSKAPSEGFPSHLLQNYYKHNNNNNNAVVETLIPNAVYVARNALSSKECQEWINYVEEHAGNEWDEVSHPATKWIAHRECGRIQKNDWNMSHRLYNRIEQIVQHISPQLDIFDKATLSPLSNNNAVETKNNLLTNKKYQPITCNPNLRLYKYTKGQWFGRHVDGSNKINLSTTTSSGNNKNVVYNADTPYSTIDDDGVKDAQTEITVLFYLSSCNGGATRFHLPCSSSSSNSGTKKKKGGRKTNEESGSIAFIPEEGAVLLHVHGDRCLEHEAEPVLNGVKYVLRTDIVYGIT